MRNTKVLSEKVKHGYFIEYPDFKVFVCKGHYTVLVPHRSGQKDIWQCYRVLCKEYAHSPGADETSPPDVSGSVSDVPIVQEVDKTFKEPVYQNDFQFGDTVV